MDSYHGLSQEEFAELRARETAADESSIGTPCSICLESIDNESRVITLDCDHMFHSRCIMRWFTEQSTCPVCRHSSSAEAESQQIHAVLNIDQLFSSGLSCVIVFVYPNRIRQQTIWSVHHTLVDILSFVLKCCSDSNAGVMLHIGDNTFKTTESFGYLNQNLGSLGLLGSHEAKVTLF